ncbi:coagulation factor IX [Protopterus annectens]|uniref:coagulation factor IX n=1 Tax=Protopterus annectens TaxID=7888 RepID=UPI001CFB54CE|nr:coagulation factor IX [Protopterus annectens]
MAKFSLFGIIYLLAYIFNAECGVFLPRKSANEVLPRHKRANSAFEELKQGSLERECYEERCSYEEAREYFEDTKKTDEFWFPYQDGNQCEINPCLNGGVCKDGINSYSCWCLPDFAGKHCEIEIAKICEVNNGGCNHFCTVGESRRECSCAHGYKLQDDGTTCQPEVKYACGRAVSVESVSSPTNSRSISNSPEIGNQTENSTQALVNEDNVYENSTRDIINAENLNMTFTDGTPSNSTENESIDKEKNRIVGGTNVKKGAVPWQVLLVNTNDVGFCGGTIINEKWVVTAAHCFYPPTDFRVVSGEHNIDVREGTEKYHRVARKIEYRRYNYSQNRYNHDIGLIELLDPIEFNDYAIPVCLADGKYTEDVLMKTSEAVVSGWGRLVHMGASAKVLQYITVPFVDTAMCKASNMVRVTKAMFCAGYESGTKDSCQGDSGGPLAARFGNTWFLTGIVSWGEGCAFVGKYGMYTKVARYSDWIKSEAKLP